jgi:hypothetical protein
MMTSYKIGDKVDFCGNILEIVYTARFDGVLLYKLAGNMPYGYETGTWAEYRQISLYTEPLIPVARPGALAANLRENGGLR